MTKERMVELLKIEHECMLRKSHGDCDSRCEKCDLCQDDYELHEMYITAINILEGEHDSARIETVEAMGMLDKGQDSKESIHRWKRNGEQSVNME